MKTPVRYGMLLIVSGPSGSGKSTLAKRMFENFDGIEFSVSCTTRAMRAGEVHGRDYHFISQEQFREHIANGDFVEFATVHGNSYGTLKSEVISRVESGIDVLLDIDVQGAIQIKKLAAADPFFGRCLETVFVTPPSHTVLEQRLRGRGTDSEEVIARRLANSKKELELWREYKYIIVNDDLNTASEALSGLIKSFRLSSARLKEPPFDEY
ncbi:MAG: guanylate kinase [Victivallales bacterium]